MLWCMWLWPLAIIPDLYLPSLSLPPVISHHVLLFGRRLFFTSRKITFFKFDIFKCKCGKQHQVPFQWVPFWGAGGRGWIRDCVWVGAAVVAVAWSGHVALIWDPPVSVSLSKARKIPHESRLSLTQTVWQQLCWFLHYSLHIPDLEYVFSQSLFAFISVSALKYRSEVINPWKRAIIFCF